ncbi:MAG: hypothetical protein RBU37_21940 [Myxococcota bacterium]|jgi:hypothetical protein|nr:hypothetical protein [Myxococcota bacterium]
MLVERVPGLVLVALVSLAAQGVGGCRPEAAPRPAQQAEPPQTPSTNEEPELAVAIDAWVEEAKRAAIGGFALSWMRLDAALQRQRKEQEQMALLEVEVKNVLGYAVAASDIHLRPLGKPKGVQVVAARVTTHAAQVVGVLVNENFLPLSKAAPAVLAHWGWASADASGRERMAMEYVTRVYLDAEGGIQSQSHPIFGKKGHPAFSAPEAVSRQDGGVDVRLWYREAEGGRDSNVTLVHGEWSFAADGASGAQRTLSSFATGRRDFFQTMPEDRITP